MCTGHNLLIDSWNSGYAETLRRSDTQVGYVPTALLITNRRPDEAGGRPEKLATRERLFKDHGWTVEYGYVPEPYLRSLLPSIIRAVRVGRDKEIDTVVSINNPFHLHLIGFVVSVLLGVPWVAELRDAIVTHPDRDETGLLVYAASAVERLVVQRADRVVWIDGIQLEDDYFEQKYPGTPQEKFYKLPFMGFERSRFEAAPTAEREPFTVTYAGSFYDGWIEPFDFLEGLALCVERYETSDTAPDKPIQAEFFGDWNDRYTDAVDHLDIRDHVITHGFVNHDEVIPALKGSNLALYIGGADPKNRLNVPSKIWDYVGARTPILAIVDPGFRVASFIEGYGLGLVAEPGNPEAVCDAIEAVRTGEYEYNPPSDVFERFSRERYIAEYALILEETLE